VPVIDSFLFALQEQLDQRLQQRQARETGICPIREELYSQCFGDPGPPHPPARAPVRYLHSLNVSSRPYCIVCADELIRQVTINCAERGLLLLRVRDEIRMSIAAYQTLYESSVAFGMRKALQSEQGKSDMEAKVSGSPPAACNWHRTQLMFARILRSVMHDDASMRTTAVTTASCDVNLRLAV
jgi:hypothetical protein